VSYVELQGLGEIDRNTLTNIVIVFDIIVIIWFTVHGNLQRFWIKRETRTYQDELVDMTDFAVVIKKLPPIASIEELDELAQALTLHIDKIV